MNRELNASDAFVAAWLPGSEGGYATDVLFTDKDGNVAYDFKGTLPYSWPRTAIQTPLNYDDEDYDPLFAYGYGLSYAKPGTVGELPEEAGIELSAKNVSEFFKAGKAAFPWALVVGDPSGKKTVTTTKAESPGGVVSIVSADDGVQENIRTISYNGQGNGRFEVRGTPVDLRRENTGDMAIYMRIRPEAGADTAKVSLMMDCGTGCDPVQPLDKLLSGAKAGEWSEVSVKLSCFIDASAMEYVSAPFAVETSDKVSFSLWLDF